MKYFKQDEFQYFPNIVCEQGFEHQMVRIEVSPATFTSWAGNYRKEFKKIHECRHCFLRANLLLKDDKQKVRKKDFSFSGT